MTVLGECETILGQRGDADGQPGELKRKALDRIAVLSRLAKTTCELAVMGPEGDPLRAVTLACNIDALVLATDNVHRLLRQACPEADSAIKQMNEVKKGVFRNLSSDILAAIDYSLPVSWACVPAMRIIVQVLKDLEAIARE